MSYHIDFCDIRATNNLKTFINQLENYGFESIGEGGFGKVMSYKSCAIKILKDLKRCQELKHEMSIYKRIKERWTRELMGKIPTYNLFEQINNDYCHFNMQRIYAPLTEYDDGDKIHVGYYLDNQVFKNLKPKYGVMTVDATELQPMPRRRIIHFYVNHFDRDFKYRSEERGDLYGMNALVNTFGEAYVKQYSFALGQVLSFLVLDCEILPFDVEIILGTIEHDPKVTLYVLDYNEAQFIDADWSLDIIASEIARSMYSKDGRHYYPNVNNKYYPDFVEGVLDGRTPQHIQFLNVVLNVYNLFFQS